MKNNLLFGLPVVLLLTMVFTPVYAPGHFFLSIDSAEIFENSGFISAKINVAGNIPIGTQAFGTGVVTTGTLAVTTTHPGVLDSETQNGNKDNAIQHNHYVNLNIPPLDAGCQGATADVANISFESPGIAMWPENMYKIWEVPKASPPGEYHDALTGSGTDVDPGDQLDFELGNILGTPFGDNQVVSFFLSVGDSTVCVSVDQFHTAEPQDLFKVGGETIRIDTTSLLLAAASSTSALMITVTIAALGIGVYVFTRNPCNVRNIKVIFQDYLDRFTKTD